MNRSRVLWTSLVTSAVGGLMVLAIGGAKGSNIAITERNIIVPPCCIHFGPGGSGWLPPDVPDADPDGNEPDMSAWKVFIAINALAPSQQQVGPNNVTTNNAIWETWADDDLTFPAHPDPANPPQWPSNATTFPMLKLHLPVQNVIRQLLLEHKSPALQKTLLLQLLRVHPEIETRQLFTINPRNPPAGFTPEILIVQTGGSEEVRRNKASFDFIVSNNLWYKSGLAKAFAAAAAGGAPIAFPVNAIEVKARWIPIPASQKSQYHWNYDSTGTLYGLVALHIMTKALPNWLWATWEWTGNDGRCDYIGCHDSFGVTPSNVAPATPLGTQYPAGTLTPALLTLISAAGLGAEWQNYRLKGSQTLFSNTLAQPTLLGNSVTEKGFVQSSSCITCHGQASVDNNGNPNPTFGFLPNRQSSNGPLLPSMFYNSANPPALQYFPVDFVWGILNAN
jgi:hypothetical protein